ncbi:hypothetical protein PEX1_079460 [Penicillium expansum]|uniref:Uncharacterized protein n=1 Tax=Penicillium expansum TaxID=27334 RepID=A0A0A2KCP3_PENEN|nr:hypothetical protein PEX2_055730 [Penicillium expansum]KGO50082.1 hypothetical protein PEX2_055730 [Penicillium expansum]KGO65597.1 hypothetical protein PEX1_079460 [Penicillium expansum]
MPSVAWSQVNETNPSPYDQVFILSEAVINQSFQAMFPMPVPFSRQDKEAVRTRQTGQWISNGMVSAPQVSIHVEERSPAYLTLFTLPFTSGMIHLRTSPRGARDTFQNFPLGGWKLVFKTRIDVGAGAGFDVPHSSYNGVTLSDDALDNLKLFVNEWLNTADTRHLNVIGYSLTAQKPTSPQNFVGTFAPSIIDYAPYAWIDPRRPTVETDGLQQNALAMLTYTNSSHRSSYAPPGLQHSGAFTDSGAAFCMNMSLLWNHFLLGLLQEINQKTEVIPQKAAFATVECRYVLGKNPRHRSMSDRYFGWKQQSKDGQPHWIWKGDAQKRADKWSSRGSKMYYKFAQEELSFHAGGSDIHLKGTVIYDAQLTTIGYPWSMAFHSVTEWNLSFRMQAVAGGGIQIIRAGNPSVHAKIVKVKSNNFPDKGRINRGLHSLEKSLENYLRSGIGRITNQLGSKLKNLHKLFLPGLGVFRFGTPQFNKRGDLLADLEYLKTNAPSKFVISNRSVRDSSHEVDALPLPFEEDFESRFAHIALMSKDYPEDEPVFDEENMHQRIEMDYEHKEESDLFFDLNIIDIEKSAQYEADEDFFPGPGPGPLAGVDWDHVERTERPWHEEGDDEYTEDKGPDDKPEKEITKQPTVKTPVVDNEDGDIPPPFGPLDG